MFHSYITYVSVLVVALALTNSGCKQRANPAAEIKSVNDDFTTVKKKFSQANPMDLDTKFISNGSVWSCQTYFRGDSKAQSFKWRFSRPTNTTIRADKISIDSGEEIENSGYNLGVLRDKYSSSFTPELVYMEETQNVSPDKQHIIPNKIEPRDYEKYLLKDKTKVILKTTALRMWSNLGVGELIAEISLCGDSFRRVDETPLSQAAIAACKNARMSAWQYAVCKKV